MALPVIDIRALRTGGPGVDEVARAIDAACREHGFFLVVGHGVPDELRARVERAARAFFARPEAEKAAIAMAHGGRAWRGWFPVGGELTSGRPDRKEGIYLGTELGPEDPRVRAGTPLHGPNLFPAEPTDLRGAVLEYLDAVTALGQTILRGIALGLGLDADWFARELTADPTVLLRIFRYPPRPPDGPQDDWGVAEHTDYGLLTVLAQDASGGLQVRTGGEWIDVSPDPHAFVCNLGDMLEAMTGGRYRSTPHRVRGDVDADRVSIPLFLDPGWDVHVQPVPDVGGATDAAPPRWDDADPLAFSGTYGEYLLAKVARVFPALFADAVSPPSARD